MWNILRKAAQTAAHWKDSKLMEIMKTWKVLWFLIYELIFTSAPVSKTKNFKAKPNPKTSQIKNTLEQMMAEIQLLLHKKRLNRASVSVH